MTPITSTLCSGGWLTTRIFSNLFNNISHCGPSLTKNVLQTAKLAFVGSSHYLNGRNGNLKLVSIRWRSWLAGNQSRVTLQRKSSEKTDSDGLHDVYIPGSTARARIRKTRQRLRETKYEMSKRMEGMKENVMTIPNGLCVMRIALAPVLGYLVYINSYEIAMAIFAIAGLTDFLDGYIARNFANQKSICGTFLDPFADKLLVATSFLSLTVVGLIPTSLTALIIARDACLVGAGFYVRYASLLPPRTLWKYFDITLATASVSPSLVSKINTGLQLSLIAITLAAPVFHFVDHPYLQTLWYVTACSTVASGLGYLFTKNNYTILSKKT